VPPFWSDELYPLAQPALGEVKKYFWKKKFLWTLQPPFIFSYFYIRGRKKQETKQMPVFKYLSLSLISIVHSFIFYESHCKPLSYFYKIFSEKESYKRQSKDFVFVFKYLSLLVSYFYSSFIDFYASHCSLLFYFNRREREKSHCV
jgi:hypothetical protein